VHCWMDARAQLEKYLGRVATLQLLDTLQTPVGHVHNPRPSPLSKWLKQPKLSSREISFRAQVTAMKNVS